MVNNKLFVTLDGPRVSKDGVPVSAFIATLKGLQDALRLMVGHLENHQAKAGRPLKRVQQQSRLRLIATRPGSLVAELTLDSPKRARDPQNDLGLQGLEALRNWDGTETSTLPGSVTDRLYAIPSSLPNDIQLRVGNANLPRKVRVRRLERYLKPALDIEEAALLHGWLKEVNWDKRTAALHRYRDRKVKLQFDGSLDEEMRHSANRFVTVRGHGQFDKSERWQCVTIETIEGDHSSSEPFNLEAFLNNPDPKIFDPEKVVRASEPFDVDEFIGIIHEARDARREEPNDW